MSNPTASVTSVRLAAMDLLARREHSARELHEKLSKRFADPALNDHIAPVVAQLRADGLQSDQRFTEAWVNYRGSRGMGPAKIAHELRGKGIERPLLRDVLYATIDWEERCFEVLQRKFRIGPDATPAERGKWMRFLAQRGFESEQVRAALRRAGQIDPS
jgi:regulatory protein